MTTATATKSRPIIFSSESVKAILAERKSQTRRVVTPANSTVDGSIFPATSYAWTKLDMARAEPRDTSTLMEVVVGRDAAPKDLHLRVPAPEEESWHRVRPRWEVGDALWVKHPVKVTGRSANGFTVRDEGFGDRERSFRWEEFPHKVPNEGKHFGRGFPRMLCRLTLEIVAVRVERLNQISEADAIAEGCQSHYCSPEDTASCEPGPIRELAELLEGGFLTAKNDFCNCWDALNARRDGGAYAWAKNPWVFVLEFRRL